MANEASETDPLSTLARGDDLIGNSVDKVLHAVRAHLGMDVAFVSEFVGDVRFFRHVDSRTERAPIQVGDAAPLSQGYCKRVVDGELPELIPDTAEVPAAMLLPETQAIPIGAHLSVPLRLSDGRLYGTFCCFSFAPDPSLTQRDLGMVRALADMVAHRLDTDLRGHREHAERLERTRAAFAAGQPELVYQPIFRTDDGGISGVECLSRFRVDPPRTPDRWFSEASAVGLGTHLELRVVTAALAELGTLPGDFHIAVNVSPQTVLSDRLAGVIAPLPPERLVLELTEHDHVADYAELERALKPLRQRGVRLAIDDAGAGYASMRHVLNLRPDLIKLDMSLTHNINLDTTQRALAGALVEFGRLTGSLIVAEGVETAEALETLKSLGVQRAQGYHLSRPLPRTELVKLLAGAAQRAAAATQEAATATAPAPSSAGSLPTH